jgi:hypothetical protein
MRTRLTLGWLVITLSGCSSSAPVHRDRPPSEREVDSALGASGLPGATGIRGALRAADSAVARRGREQAVSQEP